jgi:hypothetical protein
MHMNCPDHTKNMQSNLREEARFAVEEMLTTSKPGGAALKVGDRFREAAINVMRPSVLAGSNLAGFDDIRRAAANVFPFVPPS